jgi:hypothetical protein
MNLKSMMTGAAIAATVVGGSVALSAPAEAAALDFGGAAKFDTTSGLLDFLPPAGGGTGTGSFSVVSDLIFGSAPSTFAIQDITLTSTGANQWSYLGGPLPSFISGLLGGESYTLNSFVLNTSTRKADFSGLFTKLNEIGIGEFSSQSANFLAGGASFSSTITSTPVPTPALLPGLVGLGVAALRKRKSEGSEAEETVGVKA